MSEHDDNELRELNWRHPLTPAEAERLQRHLSAHPEARAEWEAEAVLTRLLGRLPDAPVASNFAAQILQTVEREAAAGRKPWAFDLLLERLRRRVPRLAWAVGLILVGFFVWQQHQATLRGRATTTAAAMLQAAALPGPELLQDFDAIQQLSQVPPPTDVELLQALSE